MQALVKKIIAQLQEHASHSDTKMQAHFGIVGANAMGVRLPQIRSIAKAYKKNNALALLLWDTNIHEARIMASLIAEPKIFTKQDCDKWIHGFDSWDVCDQVCSNLFRFLPYINDKIIQYQNAPEEYVKRFAFAQIAFNAVHHKKVPDDFFKQYFAIIIAAATDDRNFVRKAVNWALRSIGKRNNYCKQMALDCCFDLYALENKTAIWIAKDAEKELLGKVLKL
jgi:3-methyladenine DNA glycosylase AlkD